jgi:hypothetical protein
VRPNCLIDQIKPMHLQLFATTIIKWINLIFIIVRITFQYTKIFNYVFKIYNYYYIIKF